MEDIVLLKHDDVWCYVSCEPGIQFELSQHLTFEVPGSKFMPSVKAKRWDGKIRLLKLTKSGPRIYCGLAPAIEKFAKENRYTFRADFDWKQEPPKKLPFNEWYINGERVIPHDHQLKAIYRSLTTKRSLFLSPTGSGKSMIIYTVARNLLEYVGEKKIIIMVPTTSLVEQLYSDFENYSNGDFCAKYVTRVYAGMPKEDKQIVISTWQSLINVESKHFKSVGAVLGDECHLYKSKEISKLLEKMVNATYRYGFTGTLDGTHVNQLILEGLFGPVYKVTTTNELIAESKLSDLKVKCLTLDYAPAEKKIKLETYEDEVKFLISHPKRTRFICDLANNVEGNTLILFSRVEAHGKQIYSILTKSKKKVYYIDGSTPASEREQIRKLADQEKNVIIVASSQVFATGINIKSLRNIIFAYPSKSRIRTLQSIGRALRVHDDKNHAVIYDISDDLVDKKPNYTWNHFIERLKIYVEEDFNYEVKRFDLEEIYGTKPTTTEVCRTTVY